jgi:hypothetical protein
VRKLNYNNSHRVNGSPCTHVCLLSSFEFDDEGRFPELFMPYEHWYRPVSKYSSFARKTPSSQRFNDSVAAGKVYSGTPTIIITGERPTNIILYILVQIAIYFPRSRNSWDLFVIDMYVLYIFSWPRWTLFSVLKRWFSLTSCIAVITGKLNILSQYYKISPPPHHHRWFDINDLPCC